MPKDTKLLTWLENCYPAVKAKRAAVDAFLAGIADARQSNCQLITHFNSNSDL